MDISCIEQKIKDEPSYRQDQINRLLYKDFVTSWDEATTLPKELVNQLKKDCPLLINASKLISEDKKTEKVLIKLEDRNKIEAVLMRYKDRNTVCVSTQVGCGIGCQFCATGQMGFVRNLKPGEIIDQVLYFARKLNNNNIRVSNVVYMGMGEPFLNYDNVIKSIEILNDKDKLEIGARNISISTCGIVDGIRKLANEDYQVNLAISLHAPNNQLRDKLMPINKKYSIEDILKTVDLYIEKTNRKVMFEYILLDDINDSEDHAKQLITLLKNKLIVVNLIPANPIGKFKPSKQIVINNFRKILEENNIEVVQRYSFGKDIKAACGQLATQVSLHRLD